MLSRQWLTLHMQSSVRDPFWGLITMVQSDGQPSGHDPLSLGFYGPWGCQMYLPDPLVSWIYHCSTFYLDFKHNTGKEKSLNPG